MARRSCHLSGLAEAHLLARQALQLERQMFDDVGHVGAAPQALDKAADVAGRTPMFAQGWHGREQGIREARDRRGGHTAQRLQVEHRQVHGSGGVDVGPAQRPAFD